VEVQQEVIVWLAALPLVLAAFRVITLGDRMYAPTETGRLGGETSAQSSAILFGLTFLGITVLLIGLPQTLAGGFTLLTDGRFALALMVLALGAFAVSHYLLLGFRRRQWQAFLGAALQEAALYWLLLGICRLLIDLVPAPLGRIELQAAIWTAITVFSLALILGTFSRMFRTETVTD
jgi:hypothetical protein